MENKNTKILNELEKNSELELLQGQKIIESIDNLEPTLEGVLIKTDELVKEQKKTNELLSKEETPKPEVQKVSIEGISIITIKGDKGDKGDKPSEEELVKLITPLIPEPIKGDSPTEKELLNIIEPLIPEPIKGDKGENYVLTSQDKKDIANKIKVPIIEKIVEKVEIIKEVPNELTSKEIKDKLLEIGLDFEEIKNTPDIQKIINLSKQSSKDYNLIELKDVSISTPTNSQVLKYNSTTHLWENGTINTTITGSDTQVLFFDGANNPAGNAGLTFDKTSGSLSLQGNLNFKNNTNGDPHAIYIYPQTANDMEGNGLQIFTGDGKGNANGGSFHTYLGNADSTGTGQGGDYIIDLGAGYTSGVIDNTKTGKLKINLPTIGNAITFDTSSLVSAQTYTFPDNTGTFALTSDIPTIGGSDTQVQYNDGGVFGGSSTFLWDKTYGQLTLGSTTGFTNTSNTPLEIGGTVNSFLETYMQNKSTGDTASTDYIVGADNDTMSFAGHYGDFGIAGSGFVGSAAAQGIVKNVTVNTAGTGYAVNDVLTLVGGSNDCTVTVATIGGGGSITSISLTTNGTNYTVTNFAVTGGTGSGGRINVTALYDFSLQLANDVYMYAAGGNLVMGTDDNAGVGGKVIKFHTGGVATANERMRITDSGVGIGTLANPATILSIISSGGVGTSYVLNEYYAGNTDAPYWKTIKGRGTPSAKTASLNGDSLGGFLFQGYTGSAPAYGAGIFASQTGAASTTVPTDLYFLTADGSTVPERARILSTGQFLIGASTALSTELLSVQKSQNAGTFFSVYNGTSNTAARAGLTVGNSSSLSSSGTLFINSYSAGYSTSGIGVADSASIFTAQSAGLNVGTSGAVPLLFWSNNTERARFLSGGSFLVGATVQQGGELVLFKKDQNLRTQVWISNSTAGTAAGSALTMKADTARFDFTVTSTTYTTSGINVQNSVVFDTNAGAGINLGTSNAGYVQLWTNNTQRMSIASTGQVTVGPSSVTTGDFNVISSAAAGNSTVYIRNTLNSSAATQYWDNDRGSFASYAGFFMGGSTNANTFFGQSAADRAMFVSAGASSLGLMIGTLTAQSLILGTNNASRVVIGSTGLLTHTVTLAAGQVGATHTVTSAGSAASTQVGMQVQLLAGYTGSSSTRAARFDNAAAGTGTDPFTTGNVNAGFLATASASTTGMNIGTYSLAYGSTTAPAFGVFGLGYDDAVANSTRIGVAGFATNTGSGSPIQIGGYFGLQATTPTFVSAALIADNGATTSPIFLARDNGSVVLNLIDGGRMFLGGSTAPTAILELLAGTSSANTAPLKFNSGTVETTARAGLYEYNGNHRITNVALLRFPIGGTLFDYFTDTSVGGAEADIYSSTTIANTFNANGDKVSASYGGNFVTVGTELTQLKVYFAGTAIWDSTGVAPTTGTTSWNVDVKLVRVSSTVVRYTVTLNTTGASGFVYATVGELTGLTLSNTNILKITGTSSGVGSGNGDIIGKMGVVRFDPAN